LTTQLQRTASADELADRLLAGDRLALTRLISAVEAGRDDAREAMRYLFPKTGRAHVVGVTGPPGCGKSTLTTQLALEYRARGEAVGIVAVDPTSPYTGGAILGDRVRMMELHGDPGVFMRSMATRGVMGGLARSTLDVVLLLDAFGKDVVIIETVGTGQKAMPFQKNGIVDLTVLVMNPDYGSRLQLQKIVMLDLADIVVVNKSDLQRARTAHTEIEQRLEQNRRAQRLIDTVAKRHRDPGVDRLFDLISGTGAKPAKRRQKR